VFAYQGHGVRHDATQTYAGDEPSETQLRYGTRQAGPECDQREKQRGKNQYGTPAESIGQHAEQQRADKDPDKGGTEHRAHLGGSEIDERLNIEAIHDQAQGAKNKNADLK